jgi:hypothetical protein
VRGSVRKKTLSLENSHQVRCPCCFLCLLDVQIKLRILHGVFSILLFRVIKSEHISMCYTVL